jgi:hypothetical protein
MGDEYAVETVEAEARARCWRPVKSLATGELHAPDIVWLSRVAARLDWTTIWWRSRQKRIDIIDMNTAVNKLIRLAIDQSFDPKADV